MPTSRAGGHAPGLASRDRLDHLSSFPFRWRENGIGIVNQFPIFQLDCDDFRATPDLPLDWSDALSEICRLDLGVAYLGLLNGRAVT